jgi:very-short-patch-repair endonuclease
LGQKTQLAAGHGDVYATAKLSIRRLKMLLFPKPKKKSKPKSWLKRSKKRIPQRSTFKANWDDGKRPRRRSDTEVLQKARQYRRERLIDMPVAQMAFNEILDCLGILFEAEAIFLNGDRFILIDAYVKSAKVAFEIDGFHHKSQSRYDAERDKWLLWKHGIRTVRYLNEDVLRRPQFVRQSLGEVLN